MTTESPPIDEGMVEMWRSTAHYTLALLQGPLDTAFNGVRSAQQSVATWTDDQWAHCGYDRAATEARLASLMKLATAYLGDDGLEGTHDFQQDAADLKEQAPMTEVAQ